MKIELYNDRDYCFSKNINYYTEWITIDGMFKWYRNKSRNNSRNNVWYPCAKDRSVESRGADIKFVKALTKNELFLEML